MKQITIISGKGGTGKTTLAGSLATLVRNKVLADCDVDAADLHLVLQPTILQRTEFRSSKQAVIDLDRCTQCGICETYCHFGAITDFQVDPVRCEGCELCVRICPEEAIEIQVRLSGEWYLSQTKYGPMVHARLGVGEENSGKLVTIVRDEAIRLAQELESDYVLIDGPPGIGCPVISAITGVDLVVAVTEPTVSGIHDLQRVLNTSVHFRVPACVVINKYNINPGKTAEIEDYCAANQIPVIGKIPFDPVVVEALIHGMPLVEYAQNGLTDQIQKIWHRIKNSLRE